MSSPHLNWHTFTDDCSYDLTVNGDYDENFSRIFLTFTAVGMTVDLEPSISNRP